MLYGNTVKPINRHIINNLLAMYAHDYYCSWCILNRQSLFITRWLQNKKGRNPYHYKEKHKNTTEKSTGRTMGPLCMLPSHVFQKKHTLSCSNKRTQDFKYMWFSCISFSPFSLLPGIGGVPAKLKPHLGKGKITYLLPR